MSRWFHVWWLLIIALIVGAIIVLYGMFNTSQQLSANNLYDAVYDSVQYARDDSARESRGTFVINRAVFEQRLSSYNIRGIGAVDGKNSENGSGSDTHNKLYIHYYLDNGYSEEKPNKDSNGVENEQLNSAKYQDNLKDKNDKKNPYISIRAIQVQVVPNSKNRKIIEESHKQGSTSPYSITDVNSKYVATLVVQSQDALKKSNYITNTNDFKQQQHQQPKATTNNPVRDPNKTKENYEDLTIPSYSEDKDSNGKDKDGDSTGENNTDDSIDTISNNLNKQ